VLEWGDGTATHIPVGLHQPMHSYKRPGRYTLTIVVTDRAGNVSRAQAQIKITKPKPKRKPGRPTKRH
jgi:hypothetical protein